MICNGVLYNLINFACMKYILIKIALIWVQFFGFTYLLLNIKIELEQEKI